MLLWLILGIFIVMIAVKGGDAYCLLLLEKLEADTQRLTMKLLVFFGYVFFKVPIGVINMHRFRLQ